MGQLVFLRKGAPWCPDYDLKDAKESSELYRRNCAALATRNQRNNGSKFLGQRRK